MRLRWAALVAALVAAGGCGGGDPPADAELTVYVSMPATGPAEAQGQAVVAGARQALADARGEAGGVGIRAAFLPATGDPARIGENAREAATDSTSIAYIGELDSTATLTSLPITNDARLLHVSPTAGAVELVAPFEGSDEIPDETQPSGVRTFGTLAELDASPRQLGAEAMRLVLDSVEAASDPLDRASVVEAFFGLDERDAPLGAYAIDETGVAEPR